MFYVLLRVFVYILFFVFFFNAFFFECSIVSLFMSVFCIFLMHYCCNLVVFRIFHLHNQDSFMLLGSFHVFHNALVSHVLYCSINLHPTLIQSHFVLYCNVLRVALVQFLQIYGMKMLVKSFVSHQVAHVRPQMKNFLDILLGIIQGQGIMSGTSLRCVSLRS